MRRSLATAPRGAGLFERKLWLLLERERAARRAAEEPVRVWRDRLAGGDAWPVRGVLLGGERAPAEATSRSPATAHAAPAPHGLSRWADRSGTGANGHWHPGRTGVPMEATAATRRAIAKEARTMTAPEAIRKTGPGVRPEATGGSMHARVGDEIVVQGTTDGVVARDGEVVGLHHPDGSPPYDVRWADDGRVTLYFPGPDAHVRHLAAGGGHDQER
ncbi:DUF1918 domain-containing protein [Streptomyces sp. NPDC001076]